MNNERKPLGSGESRINTDLVIAGLFLIGVGVLGYLRINVTSEFLQQKDMIKALSKAAIGGGTLLTAIGLRNIRR